MRAESLAPSHAVVALEDADDREQIFDVLLRAVRSQTKFAALLSVSSGEIRGRRALAEEGIDRSKIDAWRIPRGAVPAFEAAITSREPTVGAIRSGDMFVDGMLDQLGGASPAVLVLPIAIGQKTIALLVAHRGRDDFELADVSELVPLADAASPALARVLAARAKATTPSKPRPDTAYDVEVIVPDAAKGRQAIEQLRGAQKWEELADAIRELVAKGMDSGDPDEDEQLQLLLELGGIESERLARADRAIDAYKSALTIDAGEARVLDALQAIYVQQGQWAESAELIEKRVTLSEDPAARIALLLELAALAHERLDDSERAIAAYERILNWEPAHPTATRELEHLYSGREQWEPLAALLLDRASRDNDTTALEAVAQMYEDKLGDMRAAFLVWLAVFRREPERRHLIEQLERLGPAANAWDEILAEGRALAEELEAQHPAIAAKVWQLVGTWSGEAGHREDATQALERAAANEQEPARRAELNAQLGELYENHLGEPARAIEYFERARTDEPESPAASAALHRLYRQTGAWDKLALLLPQLAQASSNIAEAIEYRVELGDVLADHLTRTDDAIAAFQAALDADPKHGGALHGLQRVYRETGQTEALLEASELAAESADRAKQLERYPELAAAWRERGRFDRATACWQKLIELEPKDLGAHRGLASALRDNEQWGSLIVELRAQQDLLKDPTEKLALLLELGGVLATQLDDLDGAQQAFQGALGVDPENRGALDALAKLYERSGQAGSALAVLQRLLEQTKEPRARADMFQRLGHAQLDTRDLGAARLAFEQAIALDLDNALAHEGLARVHLQQDQLVAGGEELVRAAELAHQLPDKIRCLVDAAWVFRHRLQDTERARQCLALVLELEPEHADAKVALSELLQDTKQWESLWPHLEEEVARAKADAAMTPKDRAEVYARAARCALELDKFEAALGLYELACAGDPAPKLQIERAEALYRAKSLDAAAASFQTIVLRHASVLERPDLVAVYRRLAEIHTALGKLSQAQLFHQKVLELEPKHRTTLKELAELHAQRGRFDEAIANLRSLADASETKERVALLEKIGDLYRDQLKNAPRAVSTYLEALELDAGNRRLLQRLLELQSTAGQWKQAVETVARFLDHETDPVKRAAYLIAGAEIRRNELRDRSGALEGYEQALDELFKEQPLSEQTRMRGLDTFRLVDEMITADKNWKYQEQAYRRMLKRVPAGDPALVPLWDALGEVYRTRLKNFQAAIEALEVAHSLDPQKSAQRGSIIAELYGLIGKQQPREVSQRAAKLVEQDPFNPEVYRALGRASAEAGRIDEAWCAARALVFLKQATGDETALYKKLRTNETRKATGYFDEKSWQYVQHPDEDRTISAIFAHVWEGPVALRSGPAKAFEIKPKERMPIEDGSRVIAKIFRHASRVLAISPPDVYVQPHRSGRLMLANVVDRGRLQPSVIVGRDLMTGYRDTEIAAAVAALLSVLRPAYYLKLALPSVDELEAALGAAAMLVGRAGIGRPNLEPLRAQFAEEMQKRVSRHAGESLRTLVARLPDKPDLARWRSAVDMAAHRAGLLVAGELAAAARMLSTESARPGDMRPTQRVHELVAYSVSPAYFAARQHLGVAVG